MTKSEHLREVMSDKTDAELTELFDLLDSNHDRMEFGDKVYKLLHPAVQAYHEEREDEYEQQRHIDDQIHRRVA